MGKVRKKYTQSATYRHSILRIVFLLVQFFLLYTGSLPKKIFIKSGTWIKKNILSLINFRKNHRGRPRKNSIFVYWSHKFHHRINILIPKRKRVSVLLFIFLFALTSSIYFSFQLAAYLPHPTRLITPDRPLTTEFYDRNGVLLYRLYEGRNRTLVNLQDLPPFVSQATIAIEDQNFYHHLGVDPIAITRAMYHNFKDGTLEGASTITQQLIKNILLTPERTYTRKLKEAILAFWTERLYTKAEILQMYLNEAPYGGPAWGIEAAAQTYFGKTSKDLTLAEASYLAALPASPTEFSPYGTTPYLGKLRQKEVLRRMVEDEYITQLQMDEAFNQELVLKAPTNNINSPHFVMYVKDYLAQKYGQRVVSQGGLKVYTTLDLSLQEKVQQIVKAEVAKLEYLNVTNGASMVTNAETGQILAMAGSRDYYYPQFGNFNVALALRQPGSSIKPITYATAFKQGYSPGNTILDTPITFKDEWGYRYSPVNYDGKFHGAVSIRTALGSSYNIPAVRLLNAVGVENMIQTAKDLGITTFTDPQNYGLSLTLGAGDVRMIDMMSVYGTFSQLGKTNNLTPILKVIDTEGNIIEEYEYKPQQVLQPEIAYLITHILSDNKARTPAFGSNSLLTFKDHTVAVKTGTTDNKRDNLTFGYTPHYVVGAWVGNNDNTPMHKDLASGITGAAPIWNQIMKTLLDGEPIATFNRPPGIIDITVDGRKDLAVVGITPKGLVHKNNRQRESFKLNIDTSATTQSALTSH